MFNTVFEEFLYIQESSRWVQNIANKTGKPKEEVEKHWKETEKEITSPLRKGGVTDNLARINQIVKQKLGVKDEE